MRILILLFIWLLLNGCTQYQGSDLTEKEHPKLVEARELVAKQDLEGAEKVLLTFLHKHPDYALTHLQLGLLYQSMNQPVKAIYHFQKYLEKRPESEKTAGIRDVVDVERRRLAAKEFPGTLPVADGAPQTRILDLQNQLAEVEQKLAEAEVHLQQLQQTNNGNGSTPPPEWAKEKLTLLAEIRKLKQGTPGPDRPEGATIESTMKTYTVKRGDTLSGISQKMYGDAASWRKIYEANREKIPNQNALKLGTVLVIPDE